jgi:GTP pyrophosphokinase
VQTTQHCPPALLASIGALSDALTAGGLQSAALERSAEAAAIVGALTEDAELTHAVVLKPVLAASDAPPKAFAPLASPGAWRAAAALAKFAEIGLPQHWSPQQGLDARQAETLRKMLLAVVSDPRLILARLAEQLTALRHARTLPAEPRRHLALETRAIFAPLANRLGIWQLKWELEDLAFRYLEPAAYRHIAAALNERRRDRESYIEAFCAAVRAALAQSHISAEVYGRPKHMYSIHRKMQRKHLAFEQLFDVRAVRIVVESIPDCYGALGIVGSSMTTSPRPRATSTAPSTRRSSARRARASRCRFAPARCTSTPSWASRRTGRTKKAAPQTCTISARSRRSAAYSNRSAPRAATASANSSSR